MIFAKGDLKNLNIGFYIQNQTVLFTEHFNSETQIVRGDSIVFYNYMNSFSSRNPEEATFISRYKSLKSDEVIIPELHGKKLSFLIGKKGEHYYNRNQFEVDLADYSFMDFLNFSFIYTKRENSSLVFTLYKVYTKESNVFIEKVEEHFLEIVIGKGLVLNDFNLESFSSFLKKDEINFLVNQETLFYNVMFDIFSYEKGFLNIYFALPKIRINNYGNNPLFENTSSEVALAYYWFTQKQYYLFIEKMIKENQVDKIRETNPYYTHKDIPDIKDIKTLSSKNRALLKEYLGNLSNNSEYIEILSELEADEKIGNNGVTLLLEMVLTLDKLRDKYGWDVDIFRSNLSTVDFQKFQTIIHTFDITPKNLIDKAIREMFSNNFDFPDFLMIVHDYIVMCKSLSIEIDKKLPKDVVKRHDLLITRVEEIKDKATNQLFTEVAKKNQTLIREMEGAYMICVPETISELTKEGFELSHCVGSYAYPIIEGSSKIFFVRKKTSPNLSFVTVELDRNNKLIQAKGFANSKPSKEVFDFINNWLSRL